MGDLNSFQERFLALRHRMIDDGIANGVPFDPKDHRTLLERSAAEGSSFIRVTLPQLGKALDRGLVSGRFTPIPNFRSKRNTCLPILCHKVFLMIFDRSGCLRSSPNVVSIRHLRQFLLLDSKLFCEPTALQARNAKDSFIDRMVSLRKKKIPQDHPILLEASKLLGRVLTDSILDDIAPGHGPGVVAEKLDRFERWDFRTWPSLAERYYPYLTYGTHSLESWMKGGYGVKWDLNPTTRCCLVPKDFKGPRLISAESAATQYLQQGQMKSLMRYCDSHPVIGRSIRFRDQTHNQRMAQRSVAQDSVTLDLSNASDTVSAPLVWFLLREVPGLRRRIFATRSSYMLIDDQRVRLSAFAPMGSAVCFPVESLVFWAISMAAIKQVRSHEITHGGFTHRVCSLRDYEMAGDLAVFGDDIIIPRDAYPTLLSTLLTIGCEPNMSKTCVDTPFRESCGSEWYNGFDVTITRNKEYQYAADNKFEDHLALLNLQRKFFLQGLYSAAALLKDWAEEIHPTYELPVSSILDQSGTDGQILYLDSLSVSEGAKRSLVISRSSRVRTILAEYGFSVEGSTRESEWVLYHWLSAQPRDRFSCTFGHGYGISPKLKTRWNEKYHRYECRVPRPFQRSRNWPSPEKIRGQDKSCQDRRVSEQASRIEYARLFARLQGDSIERVASRDIIIRSAWSIIPLPIGLSPDSLKV